MLDLRRNSGLAQSDEASQVDRLRLLGTGDGNVQQRLDRLDVLLRISTPTKYWLCVTGSIQKFCLLNWMLELNAATTFCMTSTCVNPRSAAFALSTVTYTQGN